MGPEHETYMVVLIDSQLDRWVGRYIGKQGKKKGAEKGGREEEIERGEKREGEEKRGKEGRRAERMREGQICKHADILYTVNAQEMLPANKIKEIKYFCTQNCNNPLE